MKKIQIITSLSILFIASCSQNINKETAVKTASYFIMQSGSGASASSITKIQKNTIHLAEENGCSFTTGGICSGSCYNNEGSYKIEISDFTVQEKFVAKYTFTNCRQILSFCMALNGSSPSIVVNGTVDETTNITETSFETTQKGSITINNNTSPCNIDLKISASMESLSPTTVTFTGTICDYSYDDLKDSLTDTASICSEPTEE